MNDELTRFMQMMNERFDQLSSSIKTDLEAQRREMNAHLAPLMTALKRLDGRIEENEKKLNKFEIAAAEAKGMARVAAWIAAIAAPAASVITYLWQKLK